MARKKKEDIQEESPITPEVMEGNEDAAPAQSRDEAGPDSAALQELEGALEASRDEARRNYDSYLRAVADLENYRKRAQREKEELSRYGYDKVLREILPVMDNLERAVEHAKQEGAENGGLLQGVEMTLSQFGQVLEKFGVKPVPARGENFDPNRHEAMGQIESAEHPPNTVVQELQKGYYLHDRLLRPALVMVAKAPPAAQPGSQE